MTEERDDVLDNLCRHAQNLLRATTPLPVRLRLHAGDVGLELDWPPPGAVAPDGSGAPAAATVRDAVPSVADLHHVRAPIVGTFYRAPAPGEKPFVDHGDIVEPGRQLAVLEAMKLMNPIVADVAGRVGDVLVADGEFVEYDQPLFSLLPLDDVG
jgi:acetyl-CoA carboxylase biotin carboxyl carrier protein